MVGMHPGQKVAPAISTPSIAQVAAAQVTSLAPTPLVMPRGKLDEEEDKI